MFAQLLWFNFRFRPASACRGALAHSGRGAGGGRDTECGPSRGGRGQHGITTTYGVLCVLLGSCPWIMGPRQWRAAQSPGSGGVDSDLFLHTGFLVAAAGVLAFHARLCLWCPWTPVSGAHLGGALNPLSSRTPKQWSLASLAVPEFFLDSVPASCGVLAPFRLCSYSQPQSSPWDLTSSEA